MPWNPIGAIIGPLALFSLVARRRKSKANSYLLMVFMLVVLPLSVGLACGTTQTEEPTQTVESPATETQTAEPTTVAPATSTATPQPPTESTAPCDGCMATPDNSDLDLFNIMPEEVDPLGGIRFYLETESDALLLTRVGIGEGADHNSRDVEYVMWTVKARSIMGVSRDLASPSSIKEEVLYQGNYPSYDYAAIGGLIQLGYPTYASCATPAHRMGAPAYWDCPEKEQDIREFRQAYEKAKEIVVAAALPTEVSGYDSFVGDTVAYYSLCDYGTYNKDINRSPSYLAGGNRFHDCWFQDNEILGSPRP